MGLPSIELHYRDRAALQLLGGVLYQLVWSATRWLSLADDAVLVIEGDEDLVTGTIKDGVVVALEQEQIKHLSGKITARKSAAYETRFAFLCSFHTLSLEKKRCTFVLTTNATLGAQQVDPDVENADASRLGIDLLRTWGASSTRTLERVAELATAVKALVTSYVDRSYPSRAADAKGPKPSIDARVRRAVEFLDSAPERWGTFLRAVVRMDAGDSRKVVEEVQHSLTNDSRALGSDPEALAYRLVFEVMQFGAAPDVAARHLDRPSLDALIEGHRANLFDWTRSAQPDRLWQLDLVNDLRRRVEQLEGSRGSGVPGKELRARHLDAVRSQNGIFRVLGIGRDIPIEAAWPLAASWTAVDSERDGLLDLREERLAARSDRRALRKRDAASRVEGRCASLCGPPGRSTRRRLRDAPRMDVDGGPDGGRARGEGVRILGGASPTGTGPSATARGLQLARSSEQAHRFEMIDPRTSAIVVSERGPRMRVGLAWPWMFGLVMVGCDRASNPSSGSSDVVFSVAAPSAPVPSGANSSIGTAPSLPAPAAAEPPSGEDAVVAATKRWNTALAGRNAEALGSVYGATVRLYGVSMARDAAVAAKAASFAKSPDYTQSIGFVAVDTTHIDRVSTSFEKTWTSRGKEHTARGRLDFASEDGRWVVVDESDTATDVHLTIGPDACANVVVDLVASTKEARELLDGPTDPDGGHTSNGVDAWGVGTDDPRAVMVRVHETHEDHLATLAWFRVNILDGSVRSDLEGRLLAADRTVAAKVVATCRREKPSGP